MSATTESSMTDVESSSVNADSTPSVSALFLIKFDQKVGYVTGSTHPSELRGILLLIFFSYVIAWQRSVEGGMWLLVRILRFFMLILL